MELPKYPICIVCGNWFQLIHPLEKVVWSESQKTIVDYIPQEGDKLTVTFLGSRKPYDMGDVTIEGNVLKYENNGKLPCGVYDIVINLVCADGKRFRSHQDSIVKIVRTNKEASIPNYIELGVDTYVLDGAVFMYVPNGGDMTNYYTKEEADGRFLQKEIDPTVPSWAKQPTKPTYNAGEVHALPDTTKFGYGIDLSLNTTTYVLTLALKDQDGNVLNTKNVDFPIESVVVNGSYDANNKRVVLELQSGTSIDIPVGDLIAGLQTEITSVNMLSSDLVDDTNSTHKFVTENEKQAWNNKSDFSGDYNDLDNKPTIPTVPTISTDISTDSSDNTKTASPKAVADYVDSICGAILTRLQGI